MAVCLDTKPPVQAASTPGFCEIYEWTRSVFYSPRTHTQRYKLLHALLQQRPHYRMLYCCSDVMVLRAYPLPGISCRYRLSGMPFLDQFHYLL